MGSRLKRWGIATGVAMAGVLLATLPPGSSALSLLYQRWEVPERTGIDGRLQAVDGALWGAEWRLALARGSAALAPIGRSGPSPVVVRIVDGGVTAPVDVELTERARKLWSIHRIPTDRVRSVLVATARRDLILVEAPPIEGVCFARLENDYAGGRRVELVGRSGGRCAIESRFGKPGARVQAWADSAGALWVPEIAPWREPVPRSFSTRVQWVDAVFGSEGSAEFRYPWWASREVTACAGGREAFCGRALGLGEWTSSLRRGGWSGLGYPQELPAALISELGPDRFGELWRSDTPIPETFERLTGAPFATWAMQFVQRRTGVIVQPTALGLGGWLGWLFWMGLLTGWTFVRLRSGRAH